MHVVLVYGSLREGGALNTNMMGANFLGTAWVPGRMVSASSFYPAVVVEGIDPNEQVLVEAYEINDNHLYLLDQIEGHPSFYHRIPVNTEEFGEAWMYVWHPHMAEGREVVESGDWINYWRKE